MTTAGGTDRHMLENPQMSANMMVTCHKHSRDTGEGRDPIIQYVNVLAGHNACHHNGHLSQAQAGSVERLEAGDFAEFRNREIEPCRSQCLQI